MAQALRQEGHGDGVSATMAELRIDADELIMALEDNSGMAECYLDRETGEVLRVSGALLGDEDEEFTARIEADPGRYVFIDPIPSSAGFETMSDFVETVTDIEARRALERALAGRKPFRAFKDALLDYPAERANWFRFKDAAFRRHAEAWLADNGIEAGLVCAADKSEPRD
jgi:hypothetical protein